MFTRVRALATVVLLVASMSGHAIVNGVLLHLSLDHAGSPIHVGHHDGEAGAQHDEAHDSGHTHSLAPAAPAAPARLSGPQLRLPPPVAIVAARHLDIGRERAVYIVASPALRTWPPEPERHFILLI